MVRDRSSAKAYVALPKRRPGRPAAMSRIWGIPVKVRASVKPICEKCRVIKRHGKILVICQNVRHKQVQG